MLRRRGVGLLGAAVVGGTAYAAGRSGARSQYAEESQNQQIYEMQAQLAAQQAEAQRATAEAQRAAAAAQAAPAPSAVTMEDKLAQLQRLGELKSAGVISDDEFAIQKARILNA
ncbi:MAG TPA: SHOCT domain-containing protein [Dehalococcoidia bacterium]